METSKPPHGQGRIGRQEEKGGEVKNFQYARIIEFSRQLQLWHVKLSFLGIYMNLALFGSQLQFSRSRTTRSCGSRSF